MVPPLFDSIDTTSHEGPCHHASIPQVPPPAFHRSLSKILERLRPYMSKWKLLCFADGYFRRVIFTLGPYIADYEEQVLLSCIVRNWCPK
jgi:hypothetical protein